MIKENIKFTDNFTNKIYEIISNKNINGVSLFPMLRKEGNKLLLGTMIEENNKNLNDQNKVVRPKYWTVVDMNNYELLEFNKTEDKDYMDSKIIPLDKTFDDEFKKEQKEVERFSIKKTETYKEYLIKDMIEEVKKANSKILNKIENTIIIDNEKIDATDYIIATATEEIEKEVKKLVEIIETNKYSTIIYYYQTLIEEIINEYKETNHINMEKMKLASTIIDTYYGPAYGIKYFFNI